MKKPIFIFGCCNSGTTPLWRALKQHKGLSGPDIEGQDLQDLPASMKQYVGKATFRLWAHPKFKLCYYATENDYIKGSELIRQGRYESGFDYIEKAFSECNILMHGKTIGASEDEKLKDNDKANLFITIIFVLIVILLLAIVFIKKR